MRRPPLCFTRQLLRAVVYDFNPIVQANRANSSSSNLAAPLIRIQQPPSRFWMEHRQQQARNSRARTQINAARTRTQTEVRHHIARCMLAQLFN